MKNTKAKRGYSRDSRPDCKQVCIGLVCTPEGLPVAYEVFPGNRSDVTTVQEIVAMMESKYGQAGRVWVMDRGMVSEDNLEWLRSRGALYLVGTPRRQLRNYERELLDQGSWHEIREGLEVKLVGEKRAQERFVLCRSTDRAAKEHAMLERQLTGLHSELGKVHTALEKHPGSDPLGVERKIGKWLGKYPAAAGVTESKTGPQRTRPGNRLEDRGQDRTSQVGALCPWSLSVAHQSYDWGRAGSVEVVCAAHPGGSGVPHLEERSEPAAGLSSEDSQGGGAHPGELPLACPVETPGTVDGPPRDLAPAPENCCTNSMSCVPWMSCLPAMTARNCGCAPLPHRKNRSPSCSRTWAWSCQTGPVLWKM